MSTRANVPIGFLDNFYLSVNYDDRMSISNIALLFALFLKWSNQDFKTPFSVSRRELLLISKISGLGTYHKAMNELQMYGYIDYLPSYHPAFGSQVTFRCQSEPHEQTICNIQEMKASS